MGPTRHSWEPGNGHPSDHAAPHDLAQSGRMCKGPSYGDYAGGADRRNGSGARGILASMGFNHRNDRGIGHSANRRSRGCVRLLQVRSRSNFRAALPSQFDSPALRVEGAWAIQVDIVIKNDGQSALMLDPRYTQQLDIFRAANNAVWKTQLLAATAYCSGMTEMLRPDPWRSCQIPDSLLMRYLSTKIGRNQPSRHPRAPAWKLARNSGVLSLSLSNQPEDI